MKGVGQPRKADASGKVAGVEFYMVVHMCRRIASILGVVLTFQNVMWVSLHTSTLSPTQITPSALPQGRDT